jgi:acyl carrier protein
MSTRSAHLDMNMESLIETLKIKIIEILNLPDVTPADIPVDSDLMSSDLDIDSIDILELVIMLRKDYGVNIKNKEMAKQVFASLRSLASYILETSPEFVN